MKPFQVVICGAGIAGVEGLLRLRALVGDQVDITLLSAKPDFGYRPVAVLEPFTDAPAERYSVARIARDTDARWIPDNLTSVDRNGHTIRTSSGRTVAYDALLLAVGGRERRASEHMTVFADRDRADSYRGILADIQAGRLTRLAFVLPHGPTWPLPLYELALLTAEEMRGKARLEILFVTPEPRPLDVFGDPAATAVTKLLADAGITLYQEADVRAAGPGVLRLRHSGIDLRADRIITIPAITGPDIAGMPGGARDRFLPIDDRCRVIGTDGRIFAAGDATDLPVKHGGIGAQQADAAAAGIAHLAGLLDAPGPMHPEIRGMLLTGGFPLYLKAHLVAGRGWQAEVYENPPWPPNDKVIAAELGCYLGRIDNGE
jgi:sulfide:quinone oxidoreductase